MNISLREVREHYGRLTRLIAFMDMMFVLVMSCIGIYIADIMSQSDDAEENTIFVLYTVFVIGVILIILLAISTIMGRKGEHEAAIRFRRVLSVLSLIIGILSLIVSLSTITKTYTEWEDTYTATIFIIQLVSSILTVIAGGLLFSYSFTGNKFFDSKNVAKDIPEGMTVDKNNRIYQSVKGISYSIISLPIFLLAYYFSTEIDYFSKIDLSDNSSYAAFFKTISFVGIVTTAMVFITAILVLLKKLGNMMMTVNKRAFMINTLVQLIFVIYSFISIPKDFVVSRHPDVSYIIFSALLTVIDIIMTVTVIRGDKAN